VTCQPNASTQHSNTHEMISNSDYSSIPILVSVSAWSMHSLFRYWMSEWPLWLFLYFNTQFQVSQMHPLSIQILVGWSATLIIPAFQYWFLCQPNLCIHWVDIGWVIGYYNYSCILILSSESAKCMHSAIKYRLGNQLLWLFLHSNIGFCVSLIYAFTI
jgi:hypothetical protein